MIPTPLKYRVYKKAFFLLCKRLCLVDFIDALNILTNVCEKEEMYRTDIQEIVDETLNYYLEEME